MRSGALYTLFQPSSCLRPGSSSSSQDLLVNSAPLRDELLTLSPTDSFGPFLKVLVATVGTYTITNICLLAIFASRFSRSATLLGETLATNAVSVSIRCR